ncbi:MAG: methylated-DNA--[protein]-cysteine S-methyltransferase [Clostridia bacterium]|nr:methylated-DNA--[protein]-cysteine S-methyltransferase [Clostridia bacterium]
MPVQCEIQTPVGVLFASAEDGAIIGLSTEDPGFSRGDDPLFDLLRAELDGYFAGKRQVFDLPLSLRGTAFQRRVWEALARIPFGEVRTYGEIAEEIGSPAASRAVGMACHRNPVLLLIPCHRVIGSGGRMTGFGCGIGMKETLLALEGHSVSKSNKKKAWDKLL